MCREKLVVPLVMQRRCCKLAITDHVLCMKSVPILHSPELYLPGSPGGGGPFGSSVNPIPTREQIMPPTILPLFPLIFRPSACSGTYFLSHATLSENLMILLASSTAQLHSRDIMTTLYESRLVQPRLSNPGPNGVKPIMK